LTLKVEGLWKTFKIPHEKRNTIFENLISFFGPNQYETITVLKDINFTAEKGTCVGIIGDNGSGKSTLLKIIANILRPTRGSVDAKGKVTPFLELGVGFQPDLSARENIALYATIMGLSNREIKDKIDEVIGFAGLQKFEDTKLKNLSSGMQVRLAFSTAIQTEPDILLVDEALAVGDREFQQKCYDVFDQYKKKGVTILLVSHDLGAIRRFCDRTLLLNQGRQVAFGETDAIIDNYVYGDREPEDAPSGENETKQTRWGNRAVTITDVKLIDKFGKESMRFRSFDPMTIRICYNAIKMISDIVFGIALYSEEGNYLYGTNTELKKTFVGPVVGEGYIDLDIERIPMIAGRYLLTVAVQSRNNEHYDWIDKKYSFDVTPTGRDPGVFDVPCKWVFSPTQF